MRPRPDKSSASTILLGASSQIGYFLLPALLAGSGRVIAVSRQGIPGWFEQYKNHSQLSWCEFDELLKLPQSEPMDLVSAAPLTLFEPILEQLNLNKIIAVSSASVLFKQDSKDDRERALMTEIMQAESMLTSWAAEQQKRLSILRPTLIYGCGLDKNLSRVAALIKRWHFLPVAGAATGQRQPLHAADLAALILRLLHTECVPQNTSTEGKNNGCIWTLAGGSTVTYREMIQAVFIALEMKPRLLNLPSHLLAVLSPLVRGLNAAMIQRQNQDLCVDDQAARKLLAWSPRKFSLQAGDLFTQ